MVVLPQMLDHFENESLLLDQMILPLLPMDYRDNIQQIAASINGLVGVA